MEIKNNVKSTVSIGSNTYLLDYSEEFEGKELSDRWMNNPTYERRVAGKTSIVDNINTGVSNGVLRVGSSLDENGVYHGGEILTTDIFSHGYFESKLKVPSGDGYFPAFWGKMPGTLATGPVKNEIDFFEFYGTDKRHYPGIHTWFVPESDKLPEWIKNRNKANTDVVKKDQFVFALPYKPVELNDSSIYHIFSCEWTKEKLAFYLDGNMYFERTFKADGKWVRDGEENYYTALIEGSPIHIYFSNLVGQESNKLQPLPKDDNIGQALEVEYFRYYKPAGK